MTRKNKGMLKMKIENSKIEKFLANLSSEEIKELNAKQLEEHEREFNKFRESFKKDKCYICKLPLSRFDEDKVCLHWLTRPNGLKKKHMEQFLKSGFGYGNLSVYLRWLANIEKPFGNINDLVEEKSSNKVIEITLKYNNLEWAFSCSEADLKGHNGLSNYPHYHFQMKISNRVFIKFSDFHIPFTDEDLFIIENKKILGNQAIEAPQSQGMNAILKNDNLDILVDSLTTSNDANRSAFQLDTLIMPPDGGTLSGDLLADLMEESQRTGVPMAKLAQKLNSQVTTIVTPGPGVPEMEKRKSTRQKRGNKK